MKTWWSDDYTGSNAEISAERALVVRTTVEALRQQQTERLSAAWRHAKMFEGVSPDLVNAFGMWGLEDVAASQQVGIRRRTINIVKMIVESSQARIAGTDIRQQFLTTGGGDKAQRTAKELTALGDAVEAHNEMEINGPKMYRDAPIFGTSVAKIHEGRDGPDVLRVMLLELLVDELDAMYGKPTAIYHRRLVARDRLLADHLESAATIKAAPRVEPAMRVGPCVSDMVEVVECWHLRSSATAKDGRRMLVVSMKGKEGGALVNEEYKRDWLPFEFLRYCDPISGLWGSGQAEVLEPYQRDLNNHLAAWRERVDASTWKIFMQAGAKIAKASINNRIAGIVEHYGSAPTFNSTPDNFGEFIQGMDWIISQAFQAIGQSQLSAQSIKPAGIDSGKAMDTYADIETGRFAMVGKEYEAWRRRIVVRALLIGKEMAARGDYKPRVTQDGHMREVDWKALGDVGEGDFECRPYPTNALSKQPAARLADLDRMTQAQLITQKQAKKMFGFADVDAELNLDTAAMDYVDAIFAQMVDDEKPSTPDPVLASDLPMAIERMRASYLRLARYTDPNQKGMSLVRNWIDLAQSTLQRASAPPAGGPPPPGPPSGVAGPPPMPPGADPSQPPATPPMMPPGAPQ